MSIEQDIENALFKYVRDLDLDDVPLAWPNILYDPLPSSHVRVQHLRNQNTRMFVKGSAPHLRQGILQLTVVMPLLDGPAPATTLASSIVAEFPADLMLYENTTKVRVTSVPNLLDPEKTDVSWNVRVDVYYETLR